jgi:hypothetical protein
MLIRRILSLAAALIAAAATTIAAAGPGAASASHFFSPVQAADTAPVHEPAPARWA